MMDWQEMAQRQTVIIDDLSMLCMELISQLSQYTNIEQEEERLKGLTHE